jgi:hypothetical protein
MPANLTAHLRSLFPKDELHRQLPFLINECTFNKNYTNVPHPSEAPKTTKRKRISKNSTDPLITDDANNNTTVHSPPTPPVATVLVPDTIQTPGPTL